MNDSHQVKITDEHWRDLDAGRIEWELDASRSVLVSATQASGPSLTVKVKISDGEDAPPAALITGPQHGMSAGDLPALREVLRVAEGIAREVDARIEAETRAAEAQYGPAA